MTIIITLSIAFLLDIIAGDPPNRIHPVAWCGNLIGGIWKKRPIRPAALFGFGALICAAGLLPAAVVYPVRMLPETASIIITALLFKLTFSLKDLLKAAGKIRKALDDGHLKEARQLTSRHLVSRDTSGLTEFELSAAVVESVAENITDSFTAPLFYFLLLGLPGAWFYRWVNTCDAMLGYRRGDYEWGGKFAARVDDVLNFIPARITALLIIIAGAGRKNPAESTASVFRNAGRTDSPNAGWSMSAAAAVLGVRLEKKEHYILNGGARQPEPRDIGDCIRLCRTAAALGGLAVIAAKAAAYAL